MLIGEPCTAIELDQEAVGGFSYCLLWIGSRDGINRERCGDARHHRTLVPTPTHGSSGSKRYPVSLWTSLIIPTMFQHHSWKKILSENCTRESR
mmetsp:Transcript_51116/g.59108  ORF Transcript_51116/g.59108 Transcript_51116/m.59108 type:complete len:94 (+) Transcript_51116:133-414(+)